jgi:hypothetical protein
VGRDLQCPRNVGLTLTASIAGAQEEFAGSPEDLGLPPTLLRSFDKSERVPEPLQGVFGSLQADFVKVHSKLRTSSVIATGVAARLWEIGDIVKLVEAAEPKAAKRGPYTKRVIEPPESGLFRSTLVLDSVARNTLEAP